MLTDLDMSNPNSLVNWLLTPHNRDTLVHTYQLAEHLIAMPDVPGDVLERAFRNYALLAIHQNLLMEREGRELIANVERADTEVVRASIHRLNCQLLRVMATLMPCEHGCCCNCQAAYDDIACNAWVNRFHERPEEN